MSEPSGDAARDWGFTGPEDAAAYLGDLIRLWGVWLAGLAVLMTNSGLVLIIGGVAVIGLLLWFARPLQRRAEALVPEDTAYDRGPVLGKGTVRDRALKAFAYGEEPLSAAVELTQRSSLWLMGRRLVLGATGVAFAVVLLQAISS